MCLDNVNHMMVGISTDEQGKLTSETLFRYDSKISHMDYYITGYVYSSNLCVYMHPCRDPKLISVIA